MQDAAYGAAPVYSTHDEPYQKYDTIKINFAVKTPLDQFISLVKELLCAAELAFMQLGDRRLIFLPLQFRLADSTRRTKLLLDGEYVELRATAGCDNGSFVEITMRSSSCSLKHARRAVQVLGLARVFADAAARFQGELTPQLPMPQRDFKAN